MRRGYGSRFAAVFALVFASAVVYLNSLWNGFVYDDKTLVVENLRIREWHGVLSRLSLYRPVRWFTYAADYHLWGLNPFGFHLTNVLLHVLCTLLLYLLASKLFKGGFAPLVIALLFAVHPVGTEAVNGIASRPDLLASMFLLACLVFYMSKGRSIRLYLLSLLSFLLAVLSKEAVGVAIPAILVGYDLCCRRGVSAVGVIRRNIRYYVGYGAVGVLWMVAGSYRLEMSERVSEISGYLENSASLARASHTMVLGVWVRAVSENLRLLFFPYNLCADYPFPRVSSLLEPSVILPVLVCIGFVAIIVKTYVRWRGIFFGFFWIFVTLMPVSNFIPLTPHFVAERYLYVPSMGFCMVLGIVIDGIRCRRGRSLSPAFRETVAAALLIAIVTSYCILTVRRNYDWRSNYVLWSKTARQQPQSVPAHINLGIAYNERNLPEQAVSEYQKAVELYPGLAFARYNLGTTYQSLGLTDEAIGEFQEVIRLEPGFAVAHCNLGSAYFEKGLYEQAKAECEIAVTLDPGFALAHCNLGTVYLQRGMYDEAANEYERALQIDPGLGTALYGLGATYLVQQRLDEGIEQLRRALETDPTLSQAHYGLAVAYLRKGLRDEARHEYRTAIQMNPAFKEPPYRLMLE